MFFSQIFCAQTSSKVKTLSNFLIMQRQSTLPLIFALLLVAFMAIPTPYESKLSEQVPGEFAVGLSPQSCFEAYHVSSQLNLDQQYCPPHSAFFGVDDPAGIIGPAEKISVSGTCCPLPSRDILTNRSSIHPQSCPEQSIVTGSIRKGEDEYWLHCTEINSSRYLLGTRKKAKYWGSGKAGWQGAERIAWSNIPEAIRESQGQYLKAQYDIDGCVGFPWGSLFVEKKSKYCKDLLFSQLIYSGREGDPARGTPVLMFDSEKSHSRRAN